MALKFKPLYLAGALAYGLLLTSLPAEVSYFVLAVTYIALGVSPHKIAKNEPKPVQSSRCLKISVEIESN